MRKTELILEAGGQIRQLDKGQILFREGQTAHHFYILKAGEIQIVSTDDQGNEFIQGIVYPEMAFGEVALFADNTFPSSAIVTADNTEVVMLERSKYMDIIQNNFEFHLAVTESFARRLKLQIEKIKLLTFAKSEERILDILERYKHSFVKIGKNDYEVTLTRKEIANLANLRTETVIRCIKKMEQNKLLRIEKSKIIYNPYEIK